MTVDPLLVDVEGHVEFLLGNEAIVRGALESGVAFAAGYPGTPSSEVTDSFARIAKARGIAFEYSVNEKVAIETAFGASLCGARSIVAMKHLGLMYAGDPMSTIPYVGTPGGMVIVSAGDPSCRTSPNEQDQRHLADMLHVPMLDPSTPQEALEMTRFAFEWSERSRLPVVLRPVTWVCHTRAPVRYGRLRPAAVKGFVRDPARLVPVPANAKRLRTEIDGRLREARSLLAGSGFLRRRGSSRLAVVTSGAPAAVVEDLLEAHGIEDAVRLIVLGGVFPLPEEWVVGALAGVERVLVVEELSPYLEDALRVIASVHHLSVEILGKRTGHLPTPFELEPATIRAAFVSALGLDRASVPAGAPAPAPAGPPAPPRPPILCASCPHRSAFYAARAVFGPEALYFNDIGCYTRGFCPPLQTADALLCMGAGLTLAAGASKATGKRTVGFVGDSTFFHSGMPGLLDAAKEGADMVAVVMDNEVTAMTGFQESPTVAVSDGQVKRAVDVEGVVRALGVAQVETVDPHDLPATIAAFARAKEAKGLSVVVTRHPCPVFYEKATGEKEAPPAPPPGTEPGSPRPSTYVVLEDHCATCGREAAGHRCGLEPDACYDLAISRARAVYGDAEGTKAAVATCAEACPLFLCVQGYAAHVAAGEYARALELIMSRLPLPDAVCRVCHRPCEPTCVRADVDEPVAVNDLKRFVVDWANGQAEFPYRPEREPDHGRRVAVVGAGPSGLSAAHELRLRGYAVTLFDAKGEPGGLLRTGIPRYRLPVSAVQRDVSRILDTGVRFVGNRRLGGDLALSSLLAEHDAVYVATGAPRGRSLAIEGEGPPVVDGLRFLRWAREAERGTGRRVVVIGGGDSAIDSSRVALRTGATTARVVCLESREEMPALASQVTGAEEEGVEVLPRARIARLLGKGVEVVSVRPRRAGAKDPSDFEDVPGSERVVEADQVVVAIGQAPDASIVSEGDVELRWAGGFLVADEETGATSHPKVFAGGDVTAGRHTVTDAIAKGLRAAWAIDRSLRGADAADRRPPPPLVSPRDTTPGTRSARRSSPRRQPRELDARARAASFDEVVLPFTEEEAREEASRCMVCGLCGNCRSCVDSFGCPALVSDGGRVRIDADLCVACGVCALLCPNDAIVAKAAQAPEPAVARGGGGGEGARS